MTESIAIHTHDRIAFKRCRRKWNFSSPLRQHLTSKIESNSNTWFGSGIHFALEDYHGYRRFQSPKHAYQAYYNVFLKHFPNLLPEDHEELLGLAFGILDYYELWLSYRSSEYRTFYVDGEPQVEVEFSIEIPELTKYAGQKVVYQGAFDRIVVDPYDRLWVMDYKTVKNFDTDKLELDAQISAYCWAAEQYYGMPVEGVVYLQIKKSFPQWPKELVDGGLSVDKRQRTTHRLFKQALIEHGYDMENLPDKYVNYLNYLAEQETYEGDRYIRWDAVRRNEYFKQHEYQMIVLEGMDMLNPNIPLYPNPTRDCTWDCPYRTVCLAICDGSDWEFLLQQEFERKEDIDWRSKIDWENPQLMEPVI